MSRGRNSKLNKDKLAVYSLVILSIVFVFFLFLSFLIDDADMFKIDPKNDEIINLRKDDTNKFETMGWVRVQGTNIDYPIIRVLDYKYGHPINDKSYAWSMNEDSKFHNKIDISGHNVLNLSKNPVSKDEEFIYFEELMNFIYYDFVKENQFIQLSIDGKDYIYKVFSVNFLSLYDINELPRGEYKASEMKDFLEMLNKGNLYDFDVDVNKDDKLISLYTCTRFYGRGNNINFVVTGRLLRDDEKTKLSDVEKTKKYSEIDKIMNGGEKNE